MAKLNLEHSVVDDRYEVASRLSLGSYAEIYTARDRLNDGRLVILKALNTTLQGEIDDDLTRTLIENFENEAKAVDRVAHPNIVRRLGHGSAVDLNGTLFHYLIFEYLSGGDLRERYHGHPLSLDELLFYLGQVCSALTHAHACGVIHRDIKPHNLLLTADKKIVKIADFGVAKITNQETEEITRVGTDVYAPPEHHPLNMEGATGAVLTPSADIYSLGKTVYALITGTSPKRFSLRAITEFPPDLSTKTWSDDLLKILNRATRTEVSARYRTVAEFWSDMQALTNYDDVDSTQVRPRLDFDTVPPTPPRPDFAKPEPAHRPIVVSVPHRSRVEESIGSHAQPAVAQAPASPNRGNGVNKVEVSIHPRPQPAAGNGPVAAANQKVPVKAKAQPKLNRWQKADIFLSSHRKIILTIIALGLLVAALGIVYYSFRGSTIHVLGQSIGDGANAVVVRPANLREGATSSSNELGYLTEGTKLHVVRAVGNDPDDWSGSWLEVDIIDWKADTSTARAAHGYIYGSFVEATDGHH